MRSRSFDLSPHQSENTMQIRPLLATLGVALIPQLAAAQTPASPAPMQPAMPAATAPMTPAMAPMVMNPVATAFRDDAMSHAKNLIAAAEEMSATHYGFKPTAAQMSFADIVVHLSQGNDFLCGKIGGMTAPTRTPVKSNAKKDVLVARLKETFDFCSQALANLDDSKLAEEMSLFGPKQYTRAATMTLTTGDWADHYSQAAIYMRLNGHVPPTAKKKM